VADPLISVIMVDGGFRESFHALDCFARQSLDAGQYELIWVEYTDRPAEAVARRDDVRVFALGRREEPQRLGYAYNKGIQEARGEVLVIPDGDVACEADLLETVRREHEACDDLVLYVLRLDQPRGRYRPDWDLEHLRQTCCVKHTYNFGGCTTVRKRWLVEMNGYEQLACFAGYHYLGGDNYIRFKNMGLKIAWHPTQRVYHPWHPMAPQGKLETVPEMEQVIRQRAASWEWLAHDGMDPSRNRPCGGDGPARTDWLQVMTEYGLYFPRGRRAARGPLWRRAARFLPGHGLAGAVRRVLARALR
jgi:hypothetical protein